MSNIVIFTTLKKSIINLLLIIPLCQHDMKYNQIETIYIHIYTNH